MGGERERESWMSGERESRVDGGREIEWVVKRKVIGW